MGNLRRTTYEEARAAEALAYELASKVANLNGVGIVNSIFGYRIKINLSDSWKPGLPKRVRGVRVVYDCFVRPAIRGLRRAPE
jgi:hypothetical protein